MARKEGSMPETPKERLRSLLERMPLDRRHKDVLLKDLAAMTEEKAASLVDDLERIIETLEARSKPPGIKA
jgi:hypothetical protein